MCVDLQCKRPTDSHVAIFLRKKDLLWFEKY